MCLAFENVGGDLSGEVETIAIEVKRGRQPFATTSGQTRGYAVYADRVYLADVRDKDFTRNEMDIASALGIGLIQIAPRVCREVLSSPPTDPFPASNFAYLRRWATEVLHLSDLVPGWRLRTDYDFRNLSRAGIVKAAKNKKGFLFWNMTVGQRKRQDDAENGSSHERRFVCSDCVANLFPPTTGRTSTKK